jgi:Family of unknown function (DUF5641)
MSLHRSYDHPGPETLLHLMRAKYWLLKGRREVKRISRRCECYKLRARRFPPPIMAPLPRARVTPSFAFTHVGMDFAGPFEILIDAPKKGEKRLTCKVNVLILVCFVTRAVHFEYSYLQTTDHIVNALLRFIARRGYCHTLYCDNAKSFLKADRELKKLYQAIDWDNLQHKMISIPSRIEMVFNPPRAPHWGGVYERMVGSMKKALRATLANRNATIEEFRTGLCQAEAVVNGRPLTTVSNDTKDPLPLTPAHLVLGRALQIIPDNLGRDDLESRIDILWRKRQRLHSEFWTRWRKEYLLALQPSQKWFSPQLEPRVGEIVLTADQSSNRMDWPLGEIMEITRGRDGQVRSVLLKGRGGQLSRRDIRYCYRMEETSRDNVKHADAE